LHDGTIHFVVGTHALLEEDVRFSRLGLVIIDEQHKFGVLQRKAFTNKAAMPNILAVTATPIPRTLSIVLYGHLDLSVIDEMPPGRLPVKTVVWDNEQRGQAYGLVRDKLERGGQAYLVFPVIEEREEDGLSGVLNRFEELTRGPFWGYTAGLLHGRLSTNDKDRVMEAFKKGEIQLLCVYYRDRGRSGSAERFGHYSPSCRAVWPGSIAPVAG
jgi:ATP-dependent DNA helicase RecG